MKRLLITLICFSCIWSIVVAQEVLSYRFTKTVNQDGVISTVDSKDVCYFTFASGGNTVYLSDANGSIKNDLGTNKVYKFQYTRDNCNYYLYELRIPLFPIGSGKYSVPFWETMIVSMDKATINIVHYSRDNPETYYTYVYKRCDPQSTKPKMPTLIE